MNRFYKYKKAALIVAAVLILVFGGVFLYQKNGINYIDQST